MREQGRTVDQANAALAYLERLYPGAIGEACFIDRAGAENARVVRGQRAIPAELSTDESQAPFFAPTSAMRQGEVFQAKPYISPDIKEWVISNSTALPTGDGSRAAIVHFEVTIESFRRGAADVEGGYDVRLLDDAGRVVIDGRARSESARRSGSPPTGAGGASPGSRRQGASDRRRPSRGVPARA